MAEYAMTVSVAVETKITEVLAIPGRNNCYGYFVSWRIVASIPPSGACEYTEWRTDNVLYGTREEAEKQGVEIQNSIGENN